MTREAIESDKRSPEDDLELDLGGTLEGALQENILTMLCYERGARSNDSEPR